MNVLRITILAFGLIMGTFSAISWAEKNDDIQRTAVVIDVRTEAEWNEGHLEGAILIPHDRIEAGIKSAVGDRKTKIYLYCRSGRRTGIAFDVLQNAGYRDIINLGTVENAANVLNRPIVK